MGDMNFPDPSVTYHESWEWDGEKWAKIMKPGVPETTAIASGAMTTGEMVVVNADGTVSVASSNLTSENFIGVSKADYADGDAAAVQIAGINADQQGMTVGKQYILPDGALTTDDGSFINSISVGPKAIFASGDYSRTGHTNVYDTKANAVVAFYQDKNNSLYTTAVVGTVSGDSITFGTPLVLASTGGEVKGVVYDPSAGKTVVLYGDYISSNWVLCSKVLEVSGNGFKPPAESVECPFEYRDLSAVFDPDSKSILIAQGGSNLACVGKVSGDSISFGSPSDFPPFNTSRASATYDSVNKKWVIVCNVLNDQTVDGVSYSKYSGYVIVGTVSGDSMTFGSPCIFRDVMDGGVNGGVNGVEWLDCSFAASSGKVVITWQDSFADYRPRALVGTVSGDSMTFGSPVSIDAASGQGKPMGVIYHQEAGRVAVNIYHNNKKTMSVYMAKVTGDTVSFDDGTIVYANCKGYGSTSYGNGNISVTSTDGDASDAGSSRLVDVGASASVNVFAGTAISPTELNIKDLV
jgi:hypothetical protein